MQQKYVLTELDSGERVISERLAHVRSVAVGFWIGAGSRDETDAKAGDLIRFVVKAQFVDPGAPPAVVKPAGRAGGN